MSLDMSVVTDLGSLLHALSPELKNEVQKLEKASLKLGKRLPERDLFRHEDVCSR